MSGKTIVFCADGTWNGQNSDDDHDGVPDHTNVLKFFVSLAGHETLDDWRKSDEQEKELRDDNGNLAQIAKYLHGVGDSSNPLTKMLGGVFGSGLITRIVRGYTFLSRNYEDGDRIVLVGFSRGAYTVRALSGLISDLGLLSNKDGKLESKDQAYRLGVAAWYQHRQKIMETKPEGFLEKLAELADSLPGFGTRVLPPSAYRDATIEAIGVWDTVGSFGIPSYAGGARVDTFQFTNCKLSDKVKMGFHAVSIDEQRVDFTPTLWEDDDRVTQVLFAGAHADVGGGYPAKESGLSDCSLQWMMQALKEVGVAYTSPLPLRLGADPNGVSHSPWEDAAFALLKKQHRTLGNGLKVHQSVKVRLASQQLAYRPASIRDYVDNGWGLKEHVKVV